MYEIVVLYLLQDLSPPPNTARPLPLCSVVPDGGTKYPCVSNVVTPLNSVPYVKSLVSPGSLVATVGFPAVVIAYAVPIPANADAVTESGLLQQRIIVSLITSSACVGGVKSDV